MSKNIASSPARTNEPSLAAPRPDEADPRKRQSKCLADKPSSVIITFTETCATCGLEGHQRSLSHACPPAQAATCSAGALPAVRRGRPRGQQPPGDDCK